MRAILPLLKKDWDSPEELAEAMILTIDRVRNSRVSYVGVVQIGGTGGTMPLYVGVGPYPGRKSAQAALVRHPAVGDETLCRGTAVVPIYSQGGYEQLLTNLDNFRTKKS